MLNIIEKYESEFIDISKADIDLKEYDMYYVYIRIESGRIITIRTFCEKNAFPKLQSDEYKELVQQYGPNIMVDYFVKRLVGKDGLIINEGRSDYIYLGGRVGENGYLANRYTIKQNGKTGQQNFDDNLFKIKLQVETQENTTKNNEQLNNSQGKTYVIGDIHGMYGSYMDVMKRMTPKDCLIILGDVIDRGAGGIQILQDIIRRKKDRRNNPEITFLLGNHEMQFLDVFQIVSDKKLSKEDLLTIANWNLAAEKEEYYSLDDSERAKREQSRWKNILNQYSEQYEKIIKEKNLTEWEKSAIHIWLNYNHGDKTIFDLLSGGIVKDANEQNEIYQFLLNSYVALPKTIKNRDYLFVHAMPPKDLKILSKIQQTKRGYKFLELTRRHVSFILEERRNSTYEQAKQLGFTTILDILLNMEEL